MCALLFNPALRRIRTCLKHYDYCYFEFYSLWRHRFKTIIWRTKIYDLISCHFCYRCGCFLRRCQRGGLRGCLLCCCANCLGRFLPRWRPFSLALQKFFLHAVAEVVLTGSHRKDVGKCFCLVLRICPLVCVLDVFGGYCLCPCPSSVCRHCLQHGPNVASFSLRSRSSPSGSATQLLLSAASTGKKILPPGY